MAEPREVQHHTAFLHPALGLPKAGEEPMHPKLTRNLTHPGRTFVLAATLGLALSGCASVGSSKYNPMNWLKPSAPSEPTVLYVPPPDNRPLIAQVLTVKLQQSADGAILLATGLPPTQGWWKASLVKVAQDDDSKLVYEFRIFPPIAPMPTGTPASREVNVAVSLSNLQLDGVKSITVQANTNALTTRR
jgi:hypothetical protein